MKTTAGSLAILVAVILYGLYGIYFRLISPGFGAFSQAWIRNLILVFLLITYFGISKKQWIKVRKEDLGWIIIWPLSSVAATVLLFYVFNNLPIGTSYFVFYSTVVVSGFISGKIFYQERINTVKIISLLLVVTGLGLICSLNMDLKKSIFVVLALVAGVSVGLWNTLSKKISSKYPNLQLVFFDALVSFFACFIGAGIAGERIPVLAISASWFWLGVFTLTQLTTVALVIYGFKNLEAQKGSLIMPLEVVFGAIFGFLFFKEVLPVTIYIGGLIIASGACLSNYKVNK